MLQFFSNRNNGKYHTIQFSIVLVPSLSFFSLDEKFFIPELFSLLDLFIIMKKTKEKNVYILVFWKLSFLFSLNFLKAVFGLVLYAIRITWRTTAGNTFLLPLPLRCKTFLITPEFLGVFWWNIVLVHKFSLTHFEIIFSVAQNLR